MDKIVITREGMFNLNYSVNGAKGSSIRVLPEFADYVMRLQELEKLIKEIASE